MRVLPTGLRDVKRLCPDRHGDARGWFAEFYNARDFAEHGLPSDFAQDNQSFSAHGVLRGLHYQVGQPQGKLIRVLSGHIWDVAVDLRQGSPEFGRWTAVPLQPLDQDGNPEMLWIPEGFAHGFLVLSGSAEVLYKVTRPYDPAGERTLLWNDPALAIPWPLDALNAEKALEGAGPVLSAKDARGVPLAEAELP